ncbi:MAG: YbaB/EbfC family nucleoid-associated protein [Vulcanimicrobiaceae bacterium]
MNQAQMMQQLRKMQAEMAKAQEEIAATTVVGSAGGGAVSVEMTADHRVTKVTVAPAAVDPADVETLEDLLVVAINDANAKAQEFAQQRMGSLTGGMRIPGLM